MTELTPEVIAAAERLKRNIHESFEHPPGEPYNNDPDIETVCRFIATHQQEAAELTELREKLAESDLTIADCHHDMAAMNDELAELRAENAKLRKLADAETAFLAANGVDEITRRYCEVKAALAECKLLPKT